MTELRVHNLSVSLDGYAAGPDQSPEQPLGGGGEQLHEWIFTPDATDVDRRFRALGEQEVGATIMGRNMFGPVRRLGHRELDRLVGRGPALPPRRLRAHPLRPRPGPDGRRHDLPLRHRRHRGRPRPGPRGGGRPARPARRRGRHRAPYLRAGLVDELHVAVVPVLLGSAERLFGDLGRVTEDWTCVEFAASASVAHVRLRRR